MHFLLVPMTVLAGSTAGALVAMVFVLGPTLRRLSPRDGILIKGRVDPIMDRLTPTLLAPTGLASVAVLVFADADTDVKLLIGAGLVGLVGVGLVSRLYCDEMNRRFKKLSAREPTEAEFRKLHKLWFSGHVTRTTFGLVSAGCFATALAVW
jgi:hypothetical protein